MKTEKTYLINKKELTWHSYYNVADQEYNLLKEEEIDPAIYQQMIDLHEAPGIFELQAAMVFHLDVPIKKKGSSIIQTHPFSIYLKGNKLITFIHEPFVIQTLLNESSLAQLKTPFDFVLYLIETIILSYSPLLKEVREESQSNDTLIRKDTTNDSLYKMLDLQKTLVYFISSINLNDTVIELIKNKYQDELVDYQNKKIAILLIESKQIMTMSTLYQEIVDTTSNVLSSIINNNVNDIMKVMTVWTVIQNSAMIISGIYGMNIIGLPFTSFGITMIITALICLITWFALKRKL